MKNDHYLDILNCIRKYGPITVQRIAEIMGMSISMVNSLVTRLYMMQLLKPDDSLRSTGGRRATAYRFIGELNYCVGVALKRKIVSLALMDANQDVILCVDEDISISSMNLDSAINEIADAIKRLILDSGVTPSSLTSVGVSVPGPVDFESGVIIEIPGVPTWKHVPLKDILGKALDMDVVVDNDNNCSVLYLHEVEKLYDRKNLVYISTYPTGVSAGLMLDGEVFRGSRNMAGEIGHISLDRNGPLCPCGNKGCLELYASDMACVAYARTGLLEHPDSELYTLCGGDPENVDIERMVEAATNGDEYSLSVFTRTADYLVHVIDIAIKTFNPDMIILQSLWLHRMRDIKNQMIEDVFMQSTFVRRTDIIISARFIEKSYECAAAALAIKRQFTPLENVKLPQWLLSAEKQYDENPYRRNR